jgi:hypothetical protein
MEGEGDEIWEERGLRKGVTHCGARIEVFFRFD